MRILASNILFDPEPIESSSDEFDSARLIFSPMGHRTLNGTILYYFIEHKILKKIIKKINTSNKYKESGIFLESTSYNNTFEV
jgi:hypothetical protein